MHLAPLKEGWRISMFGQVEGEVDMTEEVVVVVTGVKGLEVWGVLGGV